MPPSPTETPTDAHAGFDPLEFWILHKSKILLLTGLFLVGLVAFGISEWSRHKTQRESQQLLAGAKGADDYRAVVAKYPKSMAAASALLLLADDLRSAGKFDDSSAQLRTFIANFPKHPLVSGAWTSLAGNQEAQGKNDEALETYRKVTSSFPTSFSAPIALLGQARLLQGQGKADDARRIYEQVIQQYQGTAFGQEAVAENQKLTKPAPAPGPAAPAAKAEAPKAEAPAPKAATPAPAPAAAPATPAPATPAPAAPKP